MTATSSCRLAVSPTHARNRVLLVWIKFLISLAVGCSFATCIDTGPLCAADLMSDGNVPIVELRGNAAEVSGPALQLENSALGHWHSTESAAQWTIEIEEPCDVDVEVIAAVQDPFAGSSFVVSAGDQQLTGKLSSTGGWFEFEVFNLGTLRLASGKVQIQLRPTELPQGVFGNIQAVRLRGARLKEAVPAPPTDLSGPIRVFTTARNDGTRLTQRNSLSFGTADPQDAAIVALDPTQQYQTIEGFGGAFTEAAAYVFSRMSPQKQEEFLRAYFDSTQGNGYRLCRTHINSCDFCLGSYAYDEVAGDVDLKHFSIEHDRKMLIPLIKAAQQVAGDEKIKLLASPWSPPAWMKTNNTMLEGGKLKPECRDVWASYYCRYLKEYAQEGIDIWAISVQNEPMATQRWESCIYTHEEERDFVRDHLGPTLKKNGYQGVKLVVWDHNRDLLFHRASTIFDDPQAAQYVWGAGFHWYVTDDFNHVGMVHDFYPDKQLLFTEGCLEHGAHLGDWSGGERYARSVINDLNHWAVGWIDWNLMLDIEGGPNHVQNYCSAPIIGDYENDQLLYNVSYYYLGHFSRFIKPGAVRIQCENTGEQLLTTAYLNPDGTVALVVLNSQDYPIAYKLRIQGAGSSAVAAEHSITTLCFKLEDVPRR